MTDALRFVAKAGVFRARDFTEQRIPRIYLERLVTRGKLEKLRGGLYASPEHEVTEHHSLVEVAKRTPHGVACLLSALQFHNLTTQAQHEIWLALDHHARRPRITSPAVRIIHMSGEPLCMGIEEHLLEGVSVRVFGAAKTVADCFKFRNKIGLDVALEALRDFRRRYPRRLDELWKYASLCRVANVMRPYLEALG